MRCVQKVPFFKKGGECPHSNTINPTPPVRMAPPIAVPLKSCDFSVFRRIKTHPITVFNPAVKRRLERTPISGIRINPAHSDPRSAPIVLKGWTADCDLAAAHICLPNGKLAPIRIVGIIIRIKPATNSQKRPTPKAACNPLLISYRFPKAGIRATTDSPIPICTKPKRFMNGLTRRVIAANRKLPTAIPSSKAVNVTEKA